MNEYWWEEGAHKRTEDMDKSWFDRKVDQLNEEIIDLQQCVAGNSTSKRWQEINKELTNKKSELKHLKWSAVPHAPSVPPPEQFG